VSVTSAIQHISGGECVETEKTLSVLLSFDAESFPEKVKLQCVSYTVRTFVLNPLQCFRCQAYGHVASVCRREIPRCEKCAGGHETNNCVVLVEGGCVC
jgi:hypothetical protein